jgi:hypothetical protein
MAQLAEIRVADTACGSGGFLIKVLRAFWQQYRRIDDACAWVQRIIKPTNGQLYLAEMPPNVEAALKFRRRWKLDNMRELVRRVAEHHLRAEITDPVRRGAATLSCCRAIIPLVGEDLRFDRLIGTTRAFPEFDLVFGIPASIETGCHHRNRRLSFTQRRKHGRTRIS